MIKDEEIKARAIDLARIASHKTANKMGKWLEIMPRYGSIFNWEILLHIQKEISIDKMIEFIAEFVDKKREAEERKRIKAARKEREEHSTLEEKAEKVLDVAILGNERVFWRMVKDEIGLDFLYDNILDSIRDGWDREQLKLFIKLYKKKK